MQNLKFASLALFIMLICQNTSLAKAFHCTLESGDISGIDSLELLDESLIINSEFEIPLEKTRVRCGNFGTQVRFDGSALGYQVILKSCTTDAEFEGHLIDEINEVASDVYCFSPDEVPSLI